MQRDEELILSWLTVYHTKISHAFYGAYTYSRCLFLWLVFHIQLYFWNEYEKPFQLRYVSCTCDSRIHIVLSIIAFHAFKDEVISKKWAVTFPQLSCWQLWTLFGLHERLTNVQFLYCLNYLQLLIRQTSRLSSISEPISISETLA